MRVVITGATGAIGHALIAECIKQNIEVLAICHRGSQRAGMLVDEVGRMLQSKRIGLDCESPDCLIKIEYLNLDEYATGLPSMPYDIFFTWHGVEPPVHHAMMKHCSSKMQPIRWMQYD